MNTPEISKTVSDAAEHPFIVGLATAYLSTGRFPEPKPAELADFFVANPDFVGDTDFDAATMVCLVALEKRLPHA